MVADAAQQRVQLCRTVLAEDEDVDRIHDLGFPSAQGGFTLLAQGFLRTTSIVTEPEVPTRPSPVTTLAVST